MSEFIMKSLNDCDEKELCNINFDNSYASIATNKYNYKNIKIYDLTIPQLNILKQTALSVGADCATHRDVITGKVEKSDCILGGSVSQLKKISQKLLQQPFKLSQLSKELENILLFDLPEMKIRNNVYDFSRPYIVGILNLTTDSFSDGGLYNDFDAAKKHLHEMIDDGADIIDIGAESTKPFSTPVEDDAQLEKLIPILDYIKSADISCPISIDTRSSIVAEECIKHGANIINDVSGLDYDKNMVSVISKYNVPIIIQHSQGTPANMQINPKYDNLIDDIYKNLYKKIQFAIENGIEQENIIIDLGIGFGKTREQNFELLNCVEDFYTLKCPVMIGISRKSLLGMQDASNEEKDIYTLALNSSLMDKNVNFLRVHNVKMTKTLLGLKVVNQ